MATNPNQYAPHVYKAWGSMMKTVNQEWPTAVHRVEVAQRRLLQQLAHRRRLR